LHAPAIAGLHGLVLPLASRVALLRSEGKSFSFFVEPSCFLALHIGGEWHGLAASLLVASLNKFRTETAFRFGAYGWFFALCL
jgi:hypothetical protein